MNYTNAFDPFQPKTGLLTAFWSCDPNFLGCTSLKLQNTLNPVDIILNNKIVFNYYYNFNVSLTNTNSKFLKSIQDTPALYINAPELTEAPLPCLGFILNYKNTALALNVNTANYQEILFNNNNYTDIVITGVSLNLTTCVALYGSNI